VTAVPPTLEQLRGIAQRHGLGISDAGLKSFLRLMPTSFDSYVAIDELPDAASPLRYDLPRGERPAPDVNQFGAWYWRTLIRGAAHGPLHGKRIAIKDNIAVGGVPMMNGSRVVEGYVPDLDASVVTRILDAGGEIVGKTVCEHLCMSGSSFTSDTGPVLNPHDTLRSAGGSSSGSAVVIAVGDADMAIGGDQGGSVRIPSCWCGIVGLKPTYGLVPYTGAVAVEMTLDHLGPMARSVHDVAVLLDVIAGDDGLDPRQPNVQAGGYLERIDEGLKGVRVGVVREGFGWPQASDPRIDQCVHDAARTLQRLGATVLDISVPEHRSGVHIFSAIATEGITALMVEGNTLGTNWKGFYDTAQLQVYADGRRSRANYYSDTVKFTILLGQYMHDTYNGRYYARAQNLARWLSAAYDRALESMDLLLMPTVPIGAPLLPAADASPEARVRAAFEMHANTTPFNVTGHPAMNVPCGRLDGLPVGLMLIGRRWEEAGMLRAAKAFEKVGPERARE
jgi:amidase